MFRCVKIRLADAEADDIMASFPAGAAASDMTTISETSILAMRAARANLLAVISSP